MVGVLSHKLRISVYDVHVDTLKQLRAKVCGNAVVWQIPLINSSNYATLLQLSVRNCFIRGSVVRYVQLPPDGVDNDILHDATRREARGG